MKADPEKYNKYCKEYRVFIDEPYTDKDIARQRFDLVFPKNKKGNCGLVLCIHGGGWIEGDKSLYTDDLFRLCKEKEVAAACINYRFLSSEVNYDDILDDITAALKAIKEKGTEYGVNFDRMLLNGVSAGAHLSLLYALKRKIDTPIKPVCIAELCGPADIEDEFYYFEKEDEPRAVDTSFFIEIIGNGISKKIDTNHFDDARPGLREYSPVNYIDKDMIPIVFGHGEQDTVVPYRTAVSLKQKLIENNIEHTFISFPNSGHPCEDKNSMKILMQFFFEYIDRYLL